ncbi:hypothetical protein AMTR_s00009p00254230 [Amborella trichopoda]|uniref:Uncharacterized protein n=1 Tax=Amborella trichopoda TaxID=13333 RepID=W1NGZ9_AMBTC|nr:hypothetical protein AMTR_s00009p00254230 [Amborella trichopoda]
MATLPTKISIMGAQRLPKPRTHSCFCCNKIEGLAKSLNLHIPKDHSNLSKGSHDRQYHAVVMKQGPSQGRGRKANGGPSWCLTCSSSMHVMEIRSFLMRFSEQVWSLYVSMLRSGHSIAPRSSEAHFARFKVACGDTELDEHLVHRESKGTRLYHLIEVNARVFVSLIQHPKRNKDC